MSGTGFPGRTKPCPFCGGQPKRLSRFTGESATAMLFYVVCYCGGSIARAYQFADSVEEVLRLWNARATAPP